MVMNDEFETRKGKLKPGKKLNHNIKIGAEGYTGIYSVYKGIAMLWFSSTHGSNFMFLCFKLIIRNFHTQKQRKVPLNPRKYNMKPNINMVLPLTLVVIRDYFELVK